MGDMLYITWGSLCLLLVISGCKSTDGAKAPVSLIWKMGAVEAQPGYYENSFVLKNISDVPLGKDWIIYYLQLSYEILQEESAPVKVEVVNANLFRMYPAEDFQPLASGDSLTVKLCCTNGLKKIPHAPEGTYWVSQPGSKQGIPLPVGLTIQSLKGVETEDWYPAPDKIYASNLALETTTQLQQTDILPPVKEAMPATGKEGFAIENRVKLTFYPDFTNKAELLKEKLATIHGLEVVSEAPVTVYLDYLPERETAVNGEYYRTDTGDGLINILAPISHGIFNGTQTLLSLLKDQEKPFRLEALFIRDYPDLPYRGQMLDIARNFTIVEHLKKLVDIMSSYKLNVLHFHFPDDEGWRLGIPSLEELTSVSARRGRTTDELERLYPGYDGNYDPPAATSGNGYYTREEFIDLLRYVAQRHVYVIPETESSGHARAVTVPMKARYHKHVNTAPEEINEHLLNDVQDTSCYVSAQSYTDNAMNAALPSTHRFMEKVIRELITMYEEVEVPLTTIHLGGDEVPEEARVGPPVCRMFMDENGMTSVHELSEYYITKTADYPQ